MDPRPSDADPPDADPFATGPIFDAPVGSEGCAGFDGLSAFDDLVSLEGPLALGAGAGPEEAAPGSARATSPSPPPQPRRLSSTIAVATLVTAIVTGPLWAMTASGGPLGVAADGMIVDRGGRTEPLALASLDPDAALEAAIEVQIPGAVAIAWAMERVDGEVATRGTATGSDPLRVELPEAFVEAGPGLVDLLVTATLDSGDTVRRAARFAIGDVT